MSSIQLVLFDVGNVLLKLKIDAFFKKVHAACPALAPAALEQELKQPGGAHWLLEEGKADFDAFYAHLVKAYGLPWSRAEYLAHWLDYFERNEPMEALVAELAAARFPMAVLSNTNSAHYDDFTVRFSIFGPMDPILGSHQLGHRKPSRQAFEAALQRLGRPARSIFYIDDLLANVETAQKVGMQAYHYAFDDAALRRALIDAGLPLASA